MSLELTPIFSFELEFNWLLDPALELSLDLRFRFSFELDLRSINSIIGFDLRAELIDPVISVDCRLADVDRTDDLLEYADDDVSSEFLVAEDERSDDLELLETSP